MLESIPSSASLSLLQELAATVTEQLFRAIPQLADDIRGRLFSLHQSHCFACIDIGKIVILSGNRLRELLTRCAGLWKGIDMGVPLLSKAIVQSATRDIAGARPVLARHQTHG